MLVWPATRQQCANNGGGRRYMAAAAAAGWNVISPVSTDI